MAKSLSLLFVFILGLGVGLLIDERNTIQAADADAPAFLIVSSNRNADTSDEDYAPYRAAAGPLAAKAGLTMTATAQEPLLLEGNWEFGNIAIEKFDSMQAIKDFWYSDDYQAAAKLRQGLSKVNFIVAVEGN